ncbi:hypothetical protein C8R44DRAFT_83954 [Mycena epipterygia]|nr:hypothetical protein C8R44DRAFT_83954 [Mycena epipterygia]
MDNSPPPAYSQEYKRPALNIAPALSLDNPNGIETLTASKRAQGRGSLPRPLPRLPGETPSFKTGTVSPLRVHKKSQSAAIPSIERPWKPPSGPIVPDHQKYLGPPAPTPVPLEYGRSAGHFQPPTPNRGREIATHFAKVSAPGNQPPPVATVDANSFYNPAVSSHLSRPPPHMQTRPSSNYP